MRANTLASQILLQDRDLDLLRDQKFPKNLEKVTLLKFTGMPRRRFPQDLKVLYIFKNKKDPKAQ